MRTVALTILQTQLSDYVFSGSTAHFHSFLFDAYFSYEMAAIPQPSKSRFKTFPKRSFVRPIIRGA